MAGKEENRIFVGGLSWDITERQLENAFSRFGKIVESQLANGMMRFRGRIQNDGNGHVHSVLVKD